MLRLFSLLTISFLLYWGCSESYSARRSPLDTEPEWIESVPTPPNAEHPAAGDVAKPGDGQDWEAASEKTTANPAIEFSVPEIRPPEGDEIKLDQTLLALVRARHERGTTAVIAVVEEGRIELEAKDRVRLEVTATSATAVAALKEHIVDLGGEVGSELRNRVYAFIPIESLETLAAVGSIWNMAVPQPVASPLDW